MYHLAQNGSIGKGSKCTKWYKMNRLIELTILLNLSILRNIRYNSIW